MMLQLSYWFETKQGKYEAFHIHNFFCCVTKFIQKKVIERQSKDNKIHDFDRCLKE